MGDHGVLSPDFARQGEVWISRTRNISEPSTMWDVRLSTFGSLELILGISSEMLEQFLFKRTCVVVLFVRFMAISSWLIFEAGPAMMPFEQHLNHPNMSPAYCGARTPSRQAVIRWVLSLYLAQLQIKTWSTVKTLKLTLQNEQHTQRFN